jgi:hypothetical protein
MSEPRQKDEIIALSIFISVLISFVICIIPHFDTSDYNFMPSSDYYGYYTGSSKVLSASYECGFGKRHLLNTSNLNVSDLHNSNSSNLIADTFDHFSLMFIIASILTLIITVLWIRSEDQEKFKEII